MAAGITGIVWNVAAMLGLVLFGACVGWAVRATQAHARRRVMIEAFVYLCEDRANSGLKADDFDLLFNRARLPEMASYVERRRGERGERDSP